MFSDLISWSLSWLFPLCYQPPNLSILIPKYFLNLSTNLYSMATTMGQMPIVSHVDNWNSSLAIFSFSRPSLTQISQWKSCHYATIDLCVTIWTMPFLVVQLVNNLPEMRETWVWSLGWDNPLEKGKGTHSRILAWRIPWIVKSMGSQRVGHDGLSLSIELSLIINFKAFYLLWMWLLSAEKWSQALRRLGFSSCSAWAQELWFPGYRAYSVAVVLRLVSLLVVSSWTRNWTHVPWIGGRILYHCASREAQE